MELDDAPAPKWKAKYKSLISQFINRQISAADFESTYLKMFKNEEEIIGGEEFDILEYLYTSADGYVADPKLRSRILTENPDSRKYGQGLDDEELRADAREAYRQLFLESDLRAAYVSRGFSRVRFNALRDLQHSNASIISPAAMNLNEFLKQAGDHGSGVGAHAEHHRHQMPHPVSKFEQSMGRALKLWTRSWTRSPKHGIFRNGLCTITIETRLMIGCATSIT